MLGSLPRPLRAPVGIAAALGVAELRRRRARAVERRLHEALSESRRALAASERARFDAQRAADRFAQSAGRDPLTGLPNRELFLDRLEHALARARRSSRRIAVIFLDLDDFKVVNDTHGHDVGDRLLTALTPRLAAALRPGDTIARFGGDEFVVLCEDLLDESDAVQIAGRIADACGEPITVGRYVQRVTVSAGVLVVAEPHTASAAAVLRDADAAMYRAKAVGKGRVEVFDDGLRARLVERVAIEMSLRRALGRGELRVFYQPVIGLPGGAVTAVEALVRWQHPRRGLLGPSDFMAVAESSGLIVEIGAWVLAEACRQVASWNAQSDREPLRLSVNLASQQLVRSDVAEVVGEILAATGLPPELLDLELTERTLLDQGNDCLPALRALKALGIRLVLDDFGTGHSSLADLRRLTIDALKIDRSFIHDLGREGDDDAIVDAVLSMASALHVGVTAEGVETRDQLARLRSHGCKHVQGFLFSPPAPPDELGELLRADAVPAGCSVLA
jgi:diguanylate cyclase (GGDEF)-like protein